MNDLMDPSTVLWIGGAIGGGVLLMLLAWSGFHLESSTTTRAGPAGAGAGSA